MGVAEYGTGGLLLTPQAGATLRSGLSMAMAATGTRGKLVAGGASGFELAFKADALWVGTSIDGVDGPAGRLKATDAAVTRLRTGLEGSRSYTLGTGLSPKPSVEAGLRHDGGDAETGAGMDVGAGLVVSHTASGLAVDVRVRTLLVHHDENFRERGIALSFSYNPTPSTRSDSTRRWRRRGAGRQPAGPRRCGAARPWRAWRTAASRRATASTSASRRARTAVPAPPESVPGTALLQIGPVSARNVEVTAGRGLRSCRSDSR